MTTAVYEALLNNITLQCVCIYIYIYMQSKFDIYIYRVFHDFRA